MFLILRYGLRVVGSGCRLAMSGSRSAKWILNASSAAALQGIAAAHPVGLSIGELDDNQPVRPAGRDFWTVLANRVSGAAETPARG